MPDSDPAVTKEQVTQVLKEAGLLTELSPELLKLANPTMTLEEVQAVLGRDKDGPTLSQIVIDERGPKDWVK